jgi:hypothetical protein
LGHELGHAYGHLGPGPRGEWPDRSDQLTNAQEELEAEAAAYLVCARAGLEIRSAEYLSQYLGPADIQKISISSIVSAVSRIEARGE